MSKQGKTGQLLWTTQRGMCTLILLQISMLISYTHSIKPVVPVVVSVLLGSCGWYTAEVRFDGIGMCCFLECSASACITASVRISAIIMQTKFRLIHYKGFNAASLPTRKISKYFPKKLSYVTQLFSSGFGIKKV